MVEQKFLFEELLGGDKKHNFFYLFLFFIITYEKVIHILCNVPNRSQEPGKLSSCLMYDGFWETHNGTTTYTITNQTKGNHHLHKGIQPLRNTFIKEYNHKGILS